MEKLLHQLICIWISYHYAKFYTSKRWLFGISEPSTTTIYQEAPPSGSTWPLQCLVLPAGSVALPGPRCPRHLKENKENVKKHEGFLGSEQKHMPLLKMKFIPWVLAPSQDASDHQDYETFVVGQSRPKPLFATVTGKGPHLSYTMLCLHSIFTYIYIQYIHYHIYLAIWSNLFICVWIM